MGQFAGKVYNTNPDGSPNFASPAFGGQSLNSLMLAGTIDPGNLSIVREIKYDDTDVATAARNLDTAVYRGNYAEYDIEGRITSGPDGSGTVTRAAFDVNGDGFITVHDRDDGVTGAVVGGVQLLTRKNLVDGDDQLRNIEFLKFADRTVQISFLASAAPTDIQWLGVTPLDVLLPSALNSTIANLRTVDPDTAAGFSYSLQPGSSANFAVSAAGAVSITNLIMASNTTSTLIIRSDDGTGASRTETFTVRTGGNGADTLNGDATDNIMYGALGADSLNGAGGNDTLYGQNGADVLSGGTGNDVMNGGAGNDTASYAGAATGVTVSLALTSAQDLDGAGAGTESDTLVSIENLTGSANADNLTGSAAANTINGGAGVDTINGAAGGDILIGGAGADLINTGAANDNVLDIIEFAASNEFGDTVTNFDANGTVDRVEFTGALNTAYDDGNNNDNFLFATGTAGGATTAANVAQANADIEALLLIDGVATASLTDATAVSAALNAEFVITGANAGEDALVVIDASDGSNFSVWQWVQAGGGETSAAELTLIGLFSANAQVTTASFDFA
jgi:Ca2+-binding RTX toxin-like protein